MSEWTSAEPVQFKDRYQAELAFRVYEAWLERSDLLNDAVIPLPVIDLVCRAARVLQKELEDGKETETQVA